MSNLLHRMLLTLRRSRPAASRLGTIVARSFKIEPIVILMLFDTDGQKNWNKFQNKLMRTNAVLSPLEAILEMQI